VQPKKLKLLTSRLLLEAASFNAASFKRGIAGTAFDVFDVSPRSSWTIDDWTNKFAEIMRISPEMARAIECPRGVPNERLKYVPVTYAITTLMIAADNPNDPYLVEDRWQQICGVA
jgi:hypothetical protein